MREFKKRSIFTQQLYDRIRDTNPGDIILYSELEKLIGMPVQSPSPGYGYLSTARKMCLYNDELVFKPVTGVGLENITDSKKAEIGFSFIGSVRRKTRKGLKEMSTIRDWGALSDNEKRSHNAAMSILGAFELMSRPSKIKKIEDATERAQKTISFKETIRLFE